MHAPTNYETNFVNITAPTGATIMLNGVPVINFAPIGGTNYEIARVPSSNSGDGTHELTGDQPFGVTVYGYGQSTSYWYAWTSLSSLSDNACSPERGQVNLGPLAQFAAHEARATHHQRPPASANRSATRRSAFS